MMNQDVPERRSICLVGKKSSFHNYLSLMCFSLSSMAAFLALAISGVKVVVGAVVVVVGAAVATAAKATNTTKTRCILEY